MKQISISYHNFYVLILICREVKYLRIKPCNSKNVISLKDHKPFFDSHSSICLFQCFGKNHCSGLQGFGAPILLHRRRRWSQSLGYSGKKIYIHSHEFLNMCCHLFWETFILFIGEQIPKIWNSRIFQLIRNKSCLYTFYCFSD